MNHDVVPVIHTNEGHGRKIRRSASTIEFKAFRQNYKSFMKENNHVLVGSKTPIFLAKRNLNAKNEIDPPLIYTRQSFVSSDKSTQ